MGAHSVRARVSASAGMAKNRRGDEAAGRTGSLIKSFIPSAIGCNKP